MSNCASLPCYDCGAPLPRMRLLRCDSCDANQALAQAGLASRFAQRCACGAMSLKAEFSGWVCDDCKQVYQAQRAVNTPVSTRIFGPWTRHRIDTQPMELPEVDFSLDRVRQPPKDPDHPHECPTCKLPALILAYSVECTEVACKWYTP